MRLLVYSVFNSFGILMVTLGNSGMTDVHNLKTCAKCVMKRKPIASLHDSFK